MEKNIAECSVGRETFIVPTGNKKTYLFVDKLRINFTLPLLYNTFDPQRIVYEKQKVEPGCKTFLFPFSF